MVFLWLYRSLIRFCPFFILCKQVNLVMYYSSYIFLKAAVVMRPSSDRPSSDRPTTFKSALQTVTEIVLLIYIHHCELLEYQLLHLKIEIIKNIHRKYSKHLQSSMRQKILLTSPLIDVHYDLPVNFDIYASSHCYPGLILFLLKK